jgi:Arc/MetJ-type ribon-helix-helix transcriptional regulator
VTIHLSKELERFVHGAVRAGLYAREEDVIHDALIRLRQTMPEDADMSGKGAKHVKSAPRTNKKPLTPDELNQRLLASGRITRLPDPAEDVDDDDPEDLPVPIEGEPLSETIIRERR